MRGSLWSCIVRGRSGALKCSSAWSLVVIHGAVKCHLTCVVVRGAVQCVVVRGHTRSG